MKNCHTLSVLILLISTHLQRVLGFTSLAYKTRTVSMSRAESPRESCKHFQRSMSSNENDGADSISFENPLLQERLHKLRAEIFSQQINLPPNPSLSATNFVSILLSELHRRPNSGIRSLIHSSSEKWKKQLLLSIGVPTEKEIDEETFVSSLGEAMARENNQYEILVVSNENEEASYDLSFPNDVIDYMDGKCWVECQFRDPDDGTLLAILGWSLIRGRITDEIEARRGAWILDQLDWQDFRSEFRPGIGREEWMRICG